MAIVMEIKCASGARALVADDYYRDVSEEELERRRQETWRVVRQIDRRIQLEKMAAKADAE